jgi:preprotein translocase subunit SecA
MGTENVKNRYEVIREDIITDLFYQHISPKVLEEDWDVEGLEKCLSSEYGANIPVANSIAQGLDVDEVLDIILRGFAVAHEAKESVMSSESMRTFEKAVMLRALDHHWKEHLAVMDQLRQSVNLRGYGQKNPVQEFKRESFSMFTELLDTINIEIVQALCSVNLEQVSAQQEKILEEQAQEGKPRQPQRAAPPKRRMVSSKQPVKNLKVGRNDPCPCGSGKKYKQCHG